VYLKAEEEERRLCGEEGEEGEMGLGEWRGEEGLEKGWRGGREERRVGLR